MSGKMDEVPPLGMIERHYCANEACGAPLDEANVRNVPWVDRKGVYRRTIGFTCEACALTMFASLRYDRATGVWKFFVQPKKIRGDLDKLVERDQRFKRTIKEMG